MSARPDRSADPTSLRHAAPAHSDAQTATARYLALLTELAPAGALLDVRYRVRGHALARFFVGAHAHSAVATIARIGRRTDVYVGVAPRVRRGGTRRDLAPTALLWADCDTQHATDAAREFTTPPTMLIASGTPQHVHAYWALSTPLEVRELEDANRRLAAALGADQGAVTNAAAITRVPGTFNFKHRPPRPVVLLSTCGARHDARQILNALPPAPSRHAPEPPPHRHVERDPLLEIEPAHYVRVLTGLEPGRDGKISCPLHEDQTPSLHVYPTAERGWRCYGRCQRGGTIYDLASAIWGIPTRGREFIELRRRLDLLFGIHRDG